MRMKIERDVAWKNFNYVNGGMRAKNTSARPGFTHFDRQDAG